MSSNNKLSQLMKQVEDKVEECIFYAINFYGKDFKLPKVCYNMTSRRIAGKARFSTWTVFVNPNFLIEYPEEIINQTVPHEVAHLICRSMYPKASAHGKEWKSIMSDCFEKDPLRCHRMRLQSKTVFKIQKQPLITTHNNKKVFLYQNNKKLEGFFKIENRKRQLILTENQLYKK